MKKYNKQFSIARFSIISTFLIIFSCGNNGNNAASSNSNNSTIEQQADMLTSANSKHFYNFGDYKNLSTCENYDCADSFVRSRGFDFSSSTNSEIFKGSKSYEYVNEKQQQNDVWKRDIISFCFAKDEGEKAVEILYETTDKDFFDVTKKILKDNGFIFDKELTKGGEMQLKYTNEKDKCLASINQNKRKNNQHNYTTYSLVIIFIK